MSDDKPWESKWCPMVRDGDDANNTRARISERNPEWSRCIGPECACWTTFTEDRVGEEGLYRVKFCYCGLAGRP